MLQDIDDQIHGRHEMGSFVIYARERIGTADI